ncbi:MAG: phosphatidylserine/phosphatidylglycerophosphate/cardiolipin synthase family protein [Reyranellaceae bacterium]
MTTAAAPSHIPGTTSGPYPARPGNLVRPLIDGEAIARRLGEAVEAARHSVWLTVAFCSDDFSFPGGRGLLFDVLDRAAARGVDVRLLVWRPNPEFRAGHRVFGGSSEQRALLAKRGARFKIRWDRAAAGYCQHQKSWMIDAGQPTETAFVGGMNLTSVALLRHDIYVEIVGPSAMDVCHNFVERWNEATERHAPDGNWACEGMDVLPLPDRPSAPRGSAIVQVQRMLDPSRYLVDRVEQSIVEQYEHAIDAARRTIFIVNQAVPVPRVARPLLRAAERGVDIVLVVPAIPEDYAYKARLDPKGAALFDGIEALAPHRGFTLAGVAEHRAGRRRARYVHAKVMLVDDSWATIGSCNLHFHSMGGNAEMNASIWDGEVVRALRCTLLAQHLALDTASLDDRAALRLFKEVAAGNRDRIERREDDWQGSAFALSPHDYARESGVKPDLT